MGLVMAINCLVKEATFEKPDPEYPQDSRKLRVKYTITGMNQADVAYRTKLKCTINLHGSYLDTFNFGKVYGCLTDVIALPIIAVTALTITPPDYVIHICDKLPEGHDHRKRPICVIPVGIPEVVVVISVTCVGYGATPMVAGCMGYSRPCGCR